MHFFFSFKILIKSIGIQIRDIAGYGISIHTKTYAWGRIKLLVFIYLSVWEKKIKI
jgi:hypothetical protein